jgi:type IV pilus assembly protein PilC
LLGEHSSSPGLHYALGVVTKDVASGTALYKALERHPRIFDTLWVSLVQAGEMGGQLPKVLKQVGSYISAQEELKGKVVTALAYPGVLAVISLSVLAFFIIRIVPVFADIFASFNIKLPPLTAAIIMISNVLVNQLAALIFVILVISFSWSAYASTEVGKVTKWNLIFSVPFFGDFIKNMMVERLLTTLSTLIESGVSILNAISVLEGVFATNPIFQRLLKSVKNEVAGGKSISAAFKKTGVLPPLVTEMMFMGEESGKLPDMLVTLSAFYREQIDQFTRRFTAIIDPILVVGIGALVGTIVLAVFLPIFKLSQVGGR